DLGNGDEGVEVSSATNTIIGGSVVGARNVIAGNSSAGIRDDGSSGTTIQGNYIGVDSTGTATLGNNFGIQTWSSSTNGVIGGSGANEGNVIGGNTYQGILLYSSSGYTVQGNYIGTDSTGTVDLGNQENGIVISSGSNHLIGGTGAGGGNVIAFNALDGITISSSTGNSILGNQIYSNGDLGIDLENDGVTANDVGDGDAGANDLQNYPVLSTVSTTGAQVTIDGSLNSTATTTFRIEFFASASADSSYYGEAERYLGFATVTTDGSGNATISETLSVVVAAGEQVTATATVIDDAGQVGIDDALAYGITSELGLSVVALSLSPVNSVPSAQNTNEDTTLVFNSANSNLISITDDSGETLQVTLSVTNGTVTLSQTTGLTITAGANGTNTVTVTGTVENINAALDGLQYDPTADYNGGDTLTLTTNDATLLALNIDTDLQGYYEFESGDSSGDTSPGGTNNGTLNGGATVVSDPTRGDVLSLDGTDDFIDISGRVSTSQQVTVSSWVNLSAGAGSSEVIDVSFNVSLRLDSTNGVQGLFWDGGVTRTTDSGVMLAGTGWHHVAYTIDSAADTQTIYIDGVAVATTNYTNAIVYSGGDGNTYIGAAQGSSNYFDGAIDDARIYDRVLSASEIANLVASPVTVSDSDAVSITIDPVNDAPVLDNGGVMSLTTITEDDINNSGDLVSAIIASAVGDRITDADSGAVEGIAISSLVNSNGTWQYDSGSGWTDVGSVSTSNSLLLRATDSLRFVPDGLNADTGYITFAAWDQTSGSAGTKVDASVYGGTTAFSSVLETAVISVTAVNDQAVADLNGADGGGNNFATTFTEGSGAVTVTDIDSTVSDVDNTTYDQFGINLSGFVDGSSEKVTIGGYTFTHGSAETVVRTVGSTDFEIDFDGTGFSIQRDISGEMPQADLQILIRSITYENTSSDPTIGDRTIDFIPQDGDALVGLTSISTITVAAANDVPVITNLGGDTLAYTEGDGASVIDQSTNAAVTDVDSSDFDTG
ncbi:MAG: hypothetical protein K0U66_04665, partial [Gammaproteobacteria bacterium]|nr:hypothetical protein [Gammaproteobacteria bacterium]